MDDERWEGMSPSERIAWIEQDARSHQEMMLRQRTLPAPQPPQQKQEPASAWYLLFYPIMAGIIALPIILGIGKYLLIGTAILLGLLLFLFIFMMWIDMVRSFSPSWFMRFWFGLLTLLLFGSGIGCLLNLYLYAYVKAHQPRLLTGEPLAAGPQRDRWLAERRPQMTNVNIDARQVHLHHHG